MYDNNKGWWFLVLKIVALEREGRCMWDPNWVLCLVKKGLGEEGRISCWDCCGFVIMSRGRWGKCG